MKAKSITASSSFNLPLTGKEEAMKPGTAIVTLTPEQLELIELGKKAQVKMQKERDRRRAYDARPDRQEKRSEYNKKKYAELKALKQEVKGLSVDDIKHLLQLARAQGEVERDLSDGEE